MGAPLFLLFVFQNTAHSASFHPLYLCTSTQPPREARHGSPPSALSSTPPTHAPFLLWPAQPGPSPRTPLPCPRAIPPRPHPAAPRPRPVSHAPARPREKTGRGPRRRRRRWKEAQEAAAGAALISGPSRTPGLAPRAGRAGDVGAAGGQACSPGGGPWPPYHRATTVTTGPCREATGLH